MPRRSREHTTLTPPSTRERGNSPHFQDLLPPTPSFSPMTRKRSISQEIRNACQLESPTPPALVIDNTLGKGSQASVYGAELTITDMEGKTTTYPCVAKKLNIRDNENEQTSAHPFFMHELVTQLVNRPTVESNVLPLLAVLNGSNTPHQQDQFAILPYCSLILFNCLKPIVQLKNTDPTLYRYIIVQFFKQMVNALQTLADCQTVHRDLKPENIGYRHNKWCLFDLDVATDAHKLASNTVSTAGTLAYMSPETFSRDPNYIPESVDIFSLGKVLAQLHGKPLHAKSCRNLYEMMQTMDSDYEKEKRLQKTQSLFLRPRESFEEKINSAKSFSDCFDIIINAMCATLPIQRPRLDQLTLASDQLVSLIASKESTESLETKMTDFFSKPENFVQAASDIQKTSSSCFSLLSCSSSFVASPAQPHESAAADSAPSFR